ncbi:MAG: alpha/beta hydrolase [Bacillota bacterium]
MGVRLEIQNLLDNIETIKPILKKNNFKMNAVNAREGLENLTRIYVTDYDKQLFTIDDIVVHGKYDIPIRIYIPEQEKKLPVACFIHGGGHMCGGITVYDKICRKLARATNHIIVAPEYRLSPEWPYPYGINDCIAAMLGIATVLTERNIAFSEGGIKLIGDSGGAAICASICMSEMNISELLITRMSLVYPSLDYTLTSDSLKKYGNGFLLETDKIKWYFDKYFQKNENRQQVSPLYNAIPENMPPTQIILADHDPLYDEGWEYAKKLNDCGVASECISIKGVVHAYLMLENLCREECDQTYQEISRFLNGDEKQ